MAVLAEIEKCIIKSEWNLKGLFGVIQNNLERKNKAGGNTHPDFKTSCNEAVIKTMWHWHQDRMQTVGTEQTALKSAPEYVVTHKGPRPFHGDRTVFPTNGVEKTVHPYAKAWCWTPTLNHTKN
jgi:hypothetical protein